MAFVDVLSAFNSFTQISKCNGFIATNTFIDVAELFVKVNVLLKRYFRCLNGVPQLYADTQSNNEILSAILFRKLEDFPCKNEIVKNECYS